MKKIKIIIIVISIFLATGCSKVEYILNIKDSNVSENINIYFEETDNKDLNLSLNQYINKKIKNDFNSLNGYNYSLNGLDSNNVLKLAKFHNNVCDLTKNSNVFSSYIYDYMSCNETDDYYELSSVGEYRKLFFMNEYYIDNIKVKISSNLKILDSNADLVTDKYYIWNYNLNTDKDKTFYLKISKSNDNKKIIKKSLKNNISKNKDFVITMIIISVLFIIFILYISSFYKKYIKKEDEY